MNFVIDESLDFPIETFLISNGYSVYSVRGESPGIDDVEVIELANKKESIIITADKDFGELAFRRKMGHRGVLLVRLEGLSNYSKQIETEATIRLYGKQLEDNFTVLKPGSIRIRKQDEERD